METIILDNHSVRFLSRNTLITLLWVAHLDRNFKIAHSVQLWASEYICSIVTHTYESTYVRPYVHMYIRTHVHIFVSWMWRFDTIQVFCIWRTNLNTSDLFSLWQLRSLHLSASFVLADCFKEVTLRPVRLSSIYVRTIVPEAIFHPPSNGKQILRNEVWRRMGNDKIQAKGSDKAVNFMVSLQLISYFCVTNIKFGLSFKGNWIAWMSFKIGGYGESST